MPDVYAVAASLMEAIDVRTEPSKMTKHEAVDVLELMRDDIQSRLEALREEIQNATV